MARRSCKVKGCLIRLTERESKAKIDDKEENGLGGKKCLAGLEIEGLLHFSWHTIGDCHENFFLDNKQKWQLHIYNFTIKRFLIN